MGKIKVRDALWGREPFFIPNKIVIDSLTQLCYYIFDYFSQLLVNNLYAHNNRRP